VTFVETINEWHGKMVSSLLSPPPALGKEGDRFGLLSLWSPSDDAPFNLPPSFFFFFFAIAVPSDSGLEAFEEEP